MFILFHLFRDMREPYYVRQSGRRGYMGSNLTDRRERPTGETLTMSTKLPKN
jgi:hypothetical protein